VYTPGVVRDLNSHCMSSWLWPCAAAYLRNSERGMHQQCIGGLCQLKSADHPAAPGYHSQLHVLRLSGHLKQHRVCITVAM
jgi:hypothetical protein